MNLEYRKQSDYLIPNLIPKNKKPYSLGKYGLLRLNQLKHYEKTLYQELLAKDELTNYLIEINKTANTRLKKLIKSLAKIENVNEELKSKDQMKWVGLMNNIKNSAEEIILNELIYN